MTILETEVKNSNQKPRGEPTITKNIFDDASYLCVSHLCISHVLLVSCVPKHPEPFCH